MEYLDEILKQILEELAGGEDIKLADIPDIELYMDQVTTFIEKKLGYMKRGSHDKILTSTMINNYIKARILMPPNKKKYSQEHIILLILIYHLKQTLSISDIETLFRPLLKEEAGLPLNDIYTAFLDLKQDMYANFEQVYANKVQLIKKTTNNIENAENRVKTELFLTVLMLISQANAEKRLAEKIIDQYFDK